MPYCAWERKEFDESEFVDYRGSVRLHKAPLGFHLTTGELPDSTVDLPDAVQAAIAELGAVDMPMGDAGAAGGAGDDTK